MLGFLDAGVSVAYHLVNALVHVLTPVAGGLAAPAAIVAFTIAVRLVLLPLGYYALRGQAAQARLQPQLAELRRRYASQPDRLQRELTALYQREGGGMLAGCLPMLAQLPVFSVMYRLFRSESVSGHPNGLLAHRLLGAPLGAHWLGAAGLLSGTGLVFLGLFALIGLAGWASARVASRTAQPVQQAQVVPAGRLAGSGHPAVRSGRPAAQPGQGSQAAVPDRLMAAVTRVIPYTTVVIAMFVPLAAGIYLLSTTSWTAAERAVLRRRAQQAATRNAGRAGAAAA